MEDPVSGHRSSGHLELDDRGLVEEGATDLGGSGVRSDEDILEGAEGPTVEERLEALGVTPFARRHRVALTSALAVVVVAAVIVAGSAVVEWVTRPAPDDGVVAATASESADIEAPEPAAGSTGVFRYAYAVTPERSGDSLRVLGLEGPGIRASTSSPAAAPQAGGTPESQVLVVPDCTDATLWRALWMDYNVRVERTDALGRVAVGRVRVPIRSGAAWPETIGAFCAQHWFAEGITAEGVRARASTGAAGNLGLEVDVRLHNALAQDVVASYGIAGPPGWEPASPPNTAVLRHGATTVLPLGLPIVDCRTPPFDQVPAPGGVGSVDGLVIRGELAVSAGDDGETKTLAGPVLVSWQGSAEREVDAAFRQVCGEAPTVRLAVLSATQVVDKSVTGELEQMTSQPAVALVVRVRLHADASRVGFADASGDDYGWFVASTRFLPASASLTDGRADVSLYWTTTCSYLGEPPQVQAIVTAHGRDYPFLLSLADPAVTAGALAICPTVSPAELSEAGWPAAR